MKVSVIRPSSDEEDEIIFRCHTLSDDISPSLGGRFEAELENDEKVIISRLYVQILKNKLGVR